MAQIEEACKVLDAEYEKVESVKVNTGPLSKADCCPVKAKGPPSLTIV